MLFFLKKTFLGKSNGQSPHGKELISQSIKKKFFNCIVFEHSSNSNFSFLDLKIILSTFLSKTHLTAFKKTQTTNKQQHQLFFLSFLSKKMNKQKVFELAKGFRGRSKNCWVLSRNRVEKALQHQYR